MAHFRRKTFLIEAFQMTREARQDQASWPNWLHEAWNEGRCDVGSLYPTLDGSQDGTLSIGMPDGQEVVPWDYWIIQGERGELRLVHPETFIHTYEAA